MPHGIIEQEHQIIFKQFSKNKLKTLDENSFITHVREFRNILNLRDSFNYCFKYSRNHNKVNSLLNKIFLYKDLVYRHNSSTDPDERKAFKLRAKLNFKEFNYNHFNKIRKYRKFKDIYDLKSYIDCVNLFKKYEYSGREGQYHRSKSRKYAKANFKSKFKNEDFKITTSPIKRDRKTCRKYNSYEKCVYLFRIETNSVKRSYIKNAAKSYFPNKYIENDFSDTRYVKTKYYSYQKCVKIYNDHSNKKSYRMSAKKAAKIYFSSQFNQNDFITKTGNKNVKLSNNRRIK